jgi:hypothetical protein
MALDNGELEALSPAIGELVTARGVVVVLVPPLTVVAVVAPTRMEFASKEVAPAALLSLAP